MFRLLDRVVWLGALVVAGIVYAAIHYPWASGIGAVVLLGASWCVGRRDRAMREARLAGLPHGAMTPAEYESRCADVLRAAGWRVRVIGRTGDRGVDVLAERAGILAAVQCKKYRGRTGSAAVQQVIAGRMHYGATLAVVCAPSGYTRAAQELANSCGVLLVSERDLHRLP